MFSWCNATSKTSQDFIYFLERYRKVYCMLNCPEFQILKLLSVYMDYILQLHRKLKDIFWVQTLINTLISHIPNVQTFRSMNGSAVIWKNILNYFLKNRINTNLISTSQNPTQNQLEPKIIGLNLAQTWFTKEKVNVPTQIPVQVKSGYLTW